VTRKRARVRCRWCGRRFQPAARGPVAIYCSASCRQRAYEKRERDKLAQDELSARLARDLEKINQLPLKRALRVNDELLRENDELTTRVAELEQELALERGYNAPPV